MPNNWPANDAANAPPNNHININNNNINNNNNNNSNFNANRNVVIHIGNFFNQHMTATLIISRALNIVGAVRNVIANDIFGVAAIFNNNNDNNLNNNNAAGAPTSHIRINLRRLNLSGIQINPVERNDDRLNDGSAGAGDGGSGGGGDNNTVANSENRSNEHPDGNEIDAGVQFDADTEPTDECDNPLKKHGHSEEERAQPEQFKILELNEAGDKENGGDITFASVGDDLPKAPTDALIDTEFQAPNCHGDPDSIAVSIVHFDDNVTALPPNQIDENRDKTVDRVAGNHDFAVSVINASDSHKNEMEHCAVVDEDKNNDDCPCIIGAPTVASIHKIDSITGECNLNSTGDMVDEDGGSRSLAHNADECSNSATGTDSRRHICSSSSNHKSNSSGGSSEDDDNDDHADDKSSYIISDSSKDPSGNRLPIVSPFK